MIVCKLIIMRRGQYFRRISQRWRGQTKQPHATCSAYLSFRNAIKLKLVVNTSSCSLEAKQAQNPNSRAISCKLGTLAASALIGLARALHHQIPVLHYRLVAAGMHTTAQRAGIASCSTTTSISPLLYAMNPMLAPVPFTAVSHKAAAAGRVAAARGLLASASHSSASTSMATPAAPLPRRSLGTPFGASASAAAARGVACRGAATAAAPAAPSPAAGADVSEGVGCMRACACFEDGARARAAAVTGTGRGAGCAPLLPPHGLGAWARAAPGRGRQSCVALVCPYAACGRA